MNYALVAHVRVSETLRFDLEQKLATGQALNPDDYDALLAILVEDVGLRTIAEDDRDTAEQSETDTRKDLDNAEERLRVAEQRLDALPEGLVEAEAQIERLEAALAELRKRYWALQEENGKLRRNQRKFSLQIRQSTYRGKEGFTIVGRAPDGKKVRMFALTRAAAEHIREKVKAGEEITQADFRYGESAA